jgi:hypothetical protein
MDPPAVATWAELSIGSLVQLVGQRGIWQIVRFQGRRVIVEQLSVNDPPQLPPRPPAQAREETKG